jgi:hypothetical protein
VTPQQPVAQVGHARVVGLVGAVGGLKNPPADELVVDEADPEAETVHLLRGCHPPRVAGDDLLACAGPTAEVAHHLEVRVELDLPLEVLVGERHQCDPLCLQRLLRHRLTRKVPVKVRALGHEPESSAQPGQRVRWRRLDSLAGRRGVGRAGP